MRRRYEVPSTYGGSRFIRATHGVRGREDGEFAVGIDGSRTARAAAAPLADGRRPDFELYGNAVDPYRVDGEASQRYGADEAYRGDNSPADRIGHDLNEKYPEAARRYTGDEAPSDAGEAPEAAGGEPEGAGGGKRSPRRASGRFHPDRPIERPHHAPPPGGHPRPPHGDFPFCPADGDLLLLALLALLAGEDGNADIVAALALLLMVR